MEQASQIVRQEPRPQRTLRSRASAKLDPMEVDEPKELPLDTEVNALEEGDQEVYNGL